MTSHFHRPFASSLVTYLSRAHFRSVADVPATPTVGGIILGQTIPRVFHIRRLWIRLRNRPS